MHLSICLIAGALRHSLQDRLSKGASGKTRDEIYLKLRTNTGWECWILGIFLLSLVFQGIGLLSNWISA